MTNISLARIEKAAATINPVFLNTPQLVFDSLSREIGADVVLKVETLNPIRSFKGRGPDYFVSRLSEKTPLVAASAGNFGQGLAFAARARGITLTVFAAENANPLKLDRMRALGAEVVLAGRDFDAAKAAAYEHAQQRGLRFVEDGRDPAIAEGAGTIAVELLRWPRPFDAVLIAVGNGSLVNGMGTWIKAHASGTRVIGVCAAGAPAMERSWRSGRVETTATADTIADGIAVRVPVPPAVEDMRAVVDEVLLVDDAAILRAMQLLLHHAGLLVEPAGAVGLAAILAHRERFAGKLMATPLCGGNVTREQFRQWFFEEG
jgi:threonine dehydratase